MEGEPNGYLALSWRAAVHVNATRAGRYQMDLASPPGALSVPGSFLVFPAAMAFARSSFGSAPSTLEEGVASLAMVPRDGFGNSLAEHPSVGHPWNLPAQYFLEVRREQAPAICDVFERL